MVDAKDVKKEIKQPSGESESLSPEQKIEFVQEMAKVPEKKELTKEEIITREALKREIDMLQLDDALKEEASEKAKKIQTLGEEEKIEYLLETVKARGIAFAIRIAKQMNDPYVLDIFHDILVKEWASYRQHLK